MSDPSKDTPIEKLTTYVGELADLLGQQPGEELMDCARRVRAAADSAPPAVADAPRWKLVTEELSWSLRCGSKSCSFFTRWLTAWRASHEHCLPSPRATPLSPRRVSGVLTT